MEVYRIHYNWLYCVQFGETFQDFEVLKEYQDPVSGLFKIVTKIEYIPSGRMGHAVIHFDDGSTQIQDNLNAVLLRAEPKEEENDKTD